jgi:AcrR family transcriptional regulator
VSAAPRLKPRTKPPEERRDELMNAAQALFLDQGTATTTIEQITERADVAKGTFYLYFKSKEDIVRALGDRFGERHLAAIKRVVETARPEDWRRRLSLWIASGVEAYLDSIRLHDALFFSALPTREGLVDNIVIDHLAALLQEGVDAKAWTVPDVRIAAVFLFSGIQAAVDDAYTKEHPVDRTRLTQRVETLCFCAVGLATPLIT